MEWVQWLVAVAMLSPCLGKTEKLFVKYGLPSLDPHRVDSFFEMPRSRPGAESDGWAMAEDRLSPDGFAILCRNNDYRVCLLYDAQGSIAGVQVSISVEDVKRSATPYPMDPNPMQEKKRILETDVYSATVLFVDNDILKSGGRTLSEDTKTAPDGMYLVLRNGEPRHLPTFDSELEGTPYRKEECFDAMGRHYLYNMSSEFECGDLETFNPVYCEHSHELIGVNYLAFGRTSVQKYGRRWFETNYGPGFKAIAPDAPDCMQKWADSYGMISLHIYVCNEPWNIHCADAV